jgi:hypothetical protein
MQGVADVRGGVFKLMFSRCSLFFAVIQFAIVLLRHVSAGWALFCFIVVVGVSIPCITINCFLPSRRVPSSVCHVPLY